ncbi:SGNH/GDSL hydrolase family protein [Roseibium sp. LAB1]
MRFQIRQHEGKGTRAASVRFAVALALALVVCSTGVAAAQDASRGDIVVAQNGPFRGFNPFAPLQRLFGGGGEKRAKKPQKTQQKPRVSRPAGAPPKFDVLEKDPNAGLILVIGDRMARGVADGLKYTLAQKPQIRVEAITEDKEGFVGEGSPDWATQVVSRIRGADVQAVVVMIGRQDLGKAFAGEPPVEFMTAEWLDSYRRKVDALVRVVRQEKKPLVWAGLPPTGDELVNADFTQLNSIFQSASEDRRVRYVDIWDIFLAEDGSFSSYGPDVDGKNTRLRTNNKIDFTWAGYRKVAFFVERELSRLLGGYGGLAFEGVEDDPNFIVLTGRTTSPEALLLGGEDEEEINPASRTYRFFAKGEPLPPMQGRVDDPRMPVAELSAPVTAVEEVIAPPGVTLSERLGTVSGQEAGGRVSVTVRPGLP